jgi:hypothetical protein
MKIDWPKDTKPTPKEWKEKTQERNSEREDYSLYRAVEEGTWSGSTPPKTPCRV